MQETMPKRADSPKFTPPGPEQIVKRELTCRPDLKKRRMKAADWILLAILTVVGGVLAFAYLGSFRVPETWWETRTEEGNDYVILSKPQDAAVTQLWVYTGIPKRDTGNKVTVGAGDKVSNVSANWSGIGSFYATPGGVESDGKKLWNGSMYKWNKVSLNESAQAGGSKYLRLSCETDGARILEAVFLDKSGKLVPLEIVSGRRDAEAYAGLIDEQDKFTGGNSLLTDMYFDEIYHARTAFEQLNGWKLYEWTHPPLGKTLISLGIAIFGMNPVGWRCVSALFSVGIIPVAYLLSKRIFRGTTFAAALTGFFVLDGLRMVQGRIATLDAISVFFILLSFYFMLLFYEGNFNRGEGNFRSYLYFSLAGVVFGVSISVKWTGVYAGLGLLAMFVVYALRRGREYLVAKRGGEDPACAGLYAQVAANFRRRFLTLIACGGVFFLAIPFCIYVLSYLPTYRGGYSYLPTGGGVTFFEHFWQNQIQMLAYHSGLKAAHQCESRWFTWLIDLKGVYFYNADTSGRYARIQSMGTPLLYWLSFLALLYYVYYLIDRGLKVKRGELDSRDPLYRSNLRILEVLFLGLLSNLLPWVFVTRATFFYHFFPSAFYYYGFLALFLRQQKVEGRKKLFAIPAGRLGELVVTDGSLMFAVVAGLIAVNFALFYPLYSGVPVSYGVSRMFAWIAYFGQHVGVW